MFFGMSGFAQNVSRTKNSINEDWKFYRSDLAQGESVELNDSSWQSINIPHTWNNIDATDDVKGYDRMICWYRKTVTVASEAANKHTFLYFEGVNQIADVYVNGSFVGKHTGGYTQFNFDITPFVIYDADNIIAVKVDNRHNVDVPPLSADFTFFGGIYRDVFLVHTNHVHFDNSNFASSGVYVTTPEVSKEKASVQIRSFLKNEADEKCKFKLDYSIVDRSGQIVFSKNQKVTVGEKSASEVMVDDIEIDKPNLWSPANPYLYKIIVQIEDIKTGKKLDEVICPLGIRWFEFTADEGFFINGEHLKLMGTNRHQDYLKMGNALHDEMHIRDVKLIKEMGGNFLRIAHYPQDPTILAMCDQLGIIATVEIPIVDKITETQEFSDNCIYMAKEMVHQNFNHPSLVIWAYMNEVLLRPPFKKDKEHHAKYLKNVTALAQQIEDAIRTEDPSRCTMIPNHGAFNLYNDAQLTQIPMVVGWNLYQGWYGSEFPDFDKFLDKSHAELPNKPMIVTEYGADVHSRLHSFNPIRFDYTVEYGNLYHEHYLKAIEERQFVAGANIWNLADFHSSYRGNARPGINCKGIVGLDRELKDTYLLYKACLHSGTVLEIGQKEWKIRGGLAPKGSNQCNQPVNVYSNAEKVELFLNGKSMGEKQVDNYKASWDIPFINGENILEAQCESDSKIVRDRNVIDFRLVPFNLKSETSQFTGLNVLMGSERYFEDKLLDVVWIPEKEYEEGSWGYIGGTDFQNKTRYGNFPISDLAIKDTDKDPIFQSQRVGLSAVKFDVPDGKYSLSLLWAELVSDIKHEKLAYNLGNDKIQQEVNERIFNVKINGLMVEFNLNLTEKYGAERAISKKYEVVVSGGEGLIIEFEPVSGNPILNALSLYRLL
jgi:beta-galactosidase